MEAVAPSDEVTIDPLVDAVRAVGHERRVGGDVVQFDVRGLEHQMCTVAFRGDVQVVLDLGLPVSHHPLADEVDGVHTQEVVTAPREVDRLFDVSFGVHACAEPDLAQRLDGAPLEHAGSDSIKHVLPAAQLEHDVLDARPSQHVGEQRTRRPCPDDDHGNPHGCSFLDLVNGMDQLYATLSTILYCRCGDHRLPRPLHHGASWLGCMA